MNKNEIKEYHKRWYENNKEKAKNFSKEWAKNNPDKVKESLKKHIEKVGISHYQNLTYKSRRRKYKEDPSFKLKMNLGTRLYRALKNQNSNKNTSTIKYLGCSIEEFKLYLEKQFLPEFTWENHGKVWEIDHIEACATFDLTDAEQQKQCFHYTNLRPLFKTTEIAKKQGYNNEIGNRNRTKFH